MPLLDHFHPPLSVDRPWEGIHSAWATTIATQLNQDHLPPDYFAIQKLNPAKGRLFSPQEYEQGTPVVVIGPVEDLLDAQRRQAVRIADRAVPACARPRPRGTPLRLTRCSPRRA